MLAVVKPYLDRDIPSSPGAVVPLHAPRRVPRHAARRGGEAPRVPREAVRGVRGGGGRRRPIQAAGRPRRAGEGAAARPLHQKAFNTVASSIAALKVLPGVAVETFESTCCGMAGAFGYEAEHYDVSMRIGELGVLPKCAPPTPTPSSRRRHQLPPPDPRRRPARGAARRADPGSGLGGVGAVGPLSVRPSTRPLRGRLRMRSRSLCHRKSTSS